MTSVHPVNYGTLASSPEDHADFSGKRLEWVRGRRGALLAFTPDGRLAHQLSRGDASTRVQRLGLTLLLALLRVGLPHTLVAARARHAQVLS